VTTGLTFCGVVGHRERCEYTVIGRKVNMAARLMCNYPNMISCDQETYHSSRLNSGFIRILPNKPLKVKRKEKEENFKYQFNSRE
jgi:adenylate cyclase 10